MTIVPPYGEEGSLYPRDRNWHPPANTPGYKSTTLRAPRHALLSLGQTRSELTGPTFGHGIIQPLDNDLIRNFSQDGGEAIGQKMIVYGQVLDENARPVRGTLVEFWQANAGGRYRHKREGYLAALDPNFGGRAARCRSDRPARPWASCCGDPALRSTAPPRRDRESKARSDPARSSGHPRSTSG